MKAIAMLKWIVENHQNTEGMDIIEVDNEFDFELFFGYQPAEQVPEGKYVYLYGDTVNREDMERMIQREEAEVYSIATDETDNENGGLCIIYLFKLED